MRWVPVRDLRPLDKPAHRRLRPELARLSDAELLRAARHPKDGAYIRVNSKTGQLMNGNGRAVELLRRAADPQSAITSDVTVPVEDYFPDDSMFTDPDGP